MSYPTQAGLHALGAVQKFFPSAILAGGYLRDVLTRRDPKDIDIFVNASSLWDVVEFEESLGAVKLQAADYIERGEVQSVWDLQGFELPVQVIMLKNGLDVIDRAKHHDFGICQVWHTGTDLDYTAEFYADIGNSTFTLVHCEDRTEFDRSMRRWDRLSEKFPGWRLVVSEGLEASIDAAG